MFNNTSNVVVTGGTFNAVQSNKAPLEILYEKAAPGAFHISEERYDAPKCHPNTRSAVIEDILEQIRIASVSCILWLYGAAGAGKSSIAQTIAELSSQDGLLIGSFFFFRAAPLRNNAKRLAASLAYQLAQTIPSTLPIIAECISNNPAIFESSLETQLERLFFQPLRSCQQDGLLVSGPRLIILDGLDECDKPDIQRHILTVLGKTLQSTSTPLVLLIASRAETLISSIMHSPTEMSNISVFHIGLNDKYNADEDIRIYLEDKFDRLKKTHSLKQYIPTKWPRRDDIDAIVQQASGQFIYAATLVRYLEANAQAPHERLRIIIDAVKRFPAKGDHSPFAELDTLYLHILSNIPTENIVQTLAILYLRLSIVDSHPTFRPRTIASRLGLSAAEVHAQILPLSSLVKFEGEDEPIRIFHASLEDFLFDERRSTKFWVKHHTVYSFIVKRYLHRFLDLASSGTVSVYIVDSITNILPLVKMDDELYDLLFELRAETPNIFESFNSGRPLPAPWHDNANDKQRFCHLTTAFLSLQGVLEEWLPDFDLWDHCLIGNHRVFHRDLAKCVLDEATHDFLAVLGLVDWRIHNDFPPKALALALGVAGSSWWTFQSIQPFADDSDAIPSAPTYECLLVLKYFLLDRALGASLAVSKAQCTRVAWKCFNIMMTANAPESLGVVKISKFESGELYQMYKWASSGLIATLSRADRSKKLIGSIRSIPVNERSLFFSNHWGRTPDCRPAIETYLQTHSRRLWLARLVRPLQRKEQEFKESMDEEGIAATTAWVVQAEAGSIYQDDRDALSNSSLAVTVRRYNTKDVTA